MVRWVCRGDRQRYAHCKCPVWPSSLELLRTMACSWCSGGDCVVKGGQGETAAWSAPAAKVPVGGLPGTQPAPGTQPGVDVRAWY